MQLCQWIGWWMEREWMGHDGLDHNGLVNRAPIS